ncbi:MAG: type II toxin-antitoxin system RelE/ParE family toxin [Alphaproteobacteria bacterium]
MRVEWSHFAHDDLENIIQYISRDSAFYAQAFAERVLTATRRLGDFPESGRMIPEAEDKTMREIIVQAYRVMYRIEPEQVLVLAVMHGSRDLTNPINQPWEDR